jgi:hypothetical protein
MSQTEILMKYGSNPYCMDELSTLLTSLVVTSQVTGQLTDFVLPRTKAYMRAWSEEFSMRRKAGDGLFSAAGVPGFPSGVPGATKPLSFAEQQAKLEPFGGVNDRYGTLVVQCRANRHTTGIARKRGIRGSAKSSGGVWEHGMLA